MSVLYVRDKDGRLIPVNDGTLPPDMSGYVRSVNGVAPDDTGDVKINIPDSGGNVDQNGLSTTAANLLITILREGVYSANQRDNITALAAKLGITEEEPDIPDIPDVPDVPDEPDEPVTPEKTLTSISATYSGGDVTVGTAVSDLTGISVTAHYSDGSSESVTGYTLSGTIVEGSNTVTVTYQGKTTTFAVTGIAESGGGDENNGTPVEMIAVNFGSKPTYYTDDGSASTATTATTNFGWKSENTFEIDTVVHFEITIANKIWRSVNVGEYDETTNTMYNYTAATDYPCEGGVPYEGNFSVRKGYKLAFVGVNNINASDSLTVTY